MTIDFLSEPERLGGIDLAAVGGTISDRVTGWPRRRAVALSLIGLVAVVLLALLLLTRYLLSYAGPHRPSAAPEVAALRDDLGVNLVPPGATVTATHARTTCGAGVALPSVWRDFTFAGTEDTFLAFYRTALPQSGWTLTADIHGSTQSLNFSRSFGTWDAAIIVDGHRLVAEVDERDVFCGTE